ncbi:hypothetical protein [Mucilaginibacter lacusdianchii]|uniref:hypothetical protein n=1 Tax=Mucilaginibacter lacusdianchii TaxID=2684211 RepID=UPI00131D035E|nr:hypothetical protein [Mucilaginibacter sp. JXJ CY 39]
MNTIKITSVVLGIILLIAGIILIILKPDVKIAYPISLIGIGGYLFAVGLSSLLLGRMFPSNPSTASTPKNVFAKRLQIFVYGLTGLVLLITIILCFTLL